MIGSKMIMIDGGKAEIEGSKVQNIWWKSKGGRRRGTVACTKFARKGPIFEFFFAYFSVIRGESLSLVHPC